ncbi:glycoside hydrolase family 38 C-terminal domain-containing protein [Spongiactinospora sp. TRM90649]|uniref:alpha-mannosidase n=1 Tax=Spongiactinospora sp. TRM90649 TaxID=3031114 RepID=UPI0023F85448|nr:glycoside hydrolase family 38 C-terminal domain-containing protein [Spongiactinospora sp. TRM90649]MDF5757081.1 glycoside hydrolase family 38 C-terminal domain-containing protein [Spongiactinospora sp. TRM90649]
MHDDRALVEARLERALRERVRPAVHARAVPLGVSVWHAPGEPVPFAHAAGQDYAPAAVGDAWGPPWGTSWFRLTGRVPAEWAGKTVEAVVDLGFDAGLPGFQCEGLGHTADGEPVKGLHPRNAWLPVAAEALGGEEVLFLVEAAANPLIGMIGGPTPLGDKATAGTAPLYRLARADLAVFDREVWELVQDLEVLDGLMRTLGEHEPRRHEILRAAERALDALDLQDVSGTATAVRDRLGAVLAAPAHAAAHRISAVGHAHIDSAWLWPQRETVRKVARTAANVTHLMTDDPGLRFAMSQAQQLAWIKEHHPPVYERVKRQVAAGRFIPTGGMWVESDTNMPGGEALARQFTHGKRFFAEEFGIDTRDVWLPDSFGYSAALPQIIKLSGSRWFLTQKISWNQTNRFPHHTFWWEGIDGSRVFTHFPPIDTYNSELSGAELARAARNYAEKGRGTRSLAPFGHGDGGGGPTREMLARARRTRDLEGSPKVRVESPGEFFAAAEAEYPDPPVWAGELYLELHRGTYTSQARTKQGNRRSEHLLREAELWCASAAVAGLADYPYDDLDRIWKRVLLHQFHDILPGSSIAWVHREAEEAYAEITAELDDLVAAAQRALAGEGDRAVVFNGSPYPRRGVPAFGAAAGPAEPGSGIRTARDDGTFVLDNGLLRAEIDMDGLIASLVDLTAGRQMLPPGTRGNLLQLHPDLPNMWDAWDVDGFYRNTVTDLTAAEEVAAEGPDAVRVVRAFGASRIRQTLRLRPGSRRLDVEADVDWRETEKILKAAFPIDVHTDRSTSEIQYGHVHRPSHVNTSWDAARFEICAHRWVHVGEPGYGVAVVNDSTYGHDVTRHARPGGGTSSTVRLSLLRAPRFPDPRTDQGRHVLRYAVAPGASIADAVREGYDMNLPLREVAGDRDVPPLVAVEGSGVVAEAVKLADDRSGDLVVRLYECLGGRAEATLTSAVPVAEVIETDLLERPLPEGRRPAPAEIRLRLRPFEIVTLRLRRGPAGEG